MKRIIFVLLVLSLSLSLGPVAEAATLIPTHRLEKFFVDNGVEYQTVPDFYGSGGSGDYFFLQTRDPADNETMGVFFELHTGTALSDTNMHWAVGLRGPHPGQPSPNHYGGRGLALGHLSFFDYCAGPGGFIEDFTGAELDLNAQITYCQPEPLLGNSIYRIDLHVSKRNVFVAIWHKRYLPFVGWYYHQIAEYSCVSDRGPNGAGYCPEYSQDSGFGGMFLGSAFLDSGHSWIASDIHVAFF